MQLLLPILLHSNPPWSSPEKKSALVSFHSSPRWGLHLCTPHLLQPQNSGKVECSSVCNKRELPKGWKLWWICSPLLLSLLLEWCCLWQKAGLDPGLPNLHPIHNTPRLNRSRVRSLSFGGMFSHLLWEDLCKDVVWDILAAPTPCHPLAHTCSQTCVSIFSRSPTWYCPYNLSNFHSASNID